MKKSFRSRVGTVVRRSSSFLGNRPTTPGVGADADPLAARPASPASAASKAPSISESVASSPPPIRPVLRQASDDAPRPMTDEPASLAAPEPAVQPEPAPAQELVPVDAAVPSAPTEPAPVFVEEPASIPDPQPREPALPVTAEPQVIAEPAPVSEPAPESTPAPAPAPAPAPTPAPTMPVPEPVTPPPDTTPPPVSFPTPASTEQAAPEPRRSLSAERLTASPHTLSTQPSREVVYSELSPIEESPMVELPPSALPPPASAAARWADAFVRPSAQPIARAESGGETPRALADGEPRRTLSQAPSYQSSITTMPIPAKGKDKEDTVGNGNGNGNGDASGYLAGRGGPVAMPMPRTPSQGTQGQTEGFPFYAEDPFRNPFRDPEPMRPASPDPTSRMDMPEPASSMPSILDQEPPREASYHEASPLPVAMPLPPLNEVTTRSVRRMASDYTLTAESSRSLSAQRNLDTDERRPLLPRGDAPQSHTPAWPTDEPTPQSLGWTEHVLPDTTSYFAHHPMRITVDADLRNPATLRRVTAYLDGTVPADIGVPPEGWEVWLRDDGQARAGAWAPVRRWVCHHARTLSYDAPSAGGARGVLDGVGAEDRLDLEYRYWHFMESHPAHAPLPYNAHTDALDALTWSYTGPPYPESLLKAQRPAKAPFTQEECRELLGLLRSLASPESHIQVVVHTRLVARILLRVAQWRQQNLRPEKALPRDVDGRMRRARARQSWTFTDVLLGTLCFGIPFFFANRHGYQRLDEESGVRTVGPLLVIGASACLVAAVILSASVTFLALPGLDHAARTAGFVAILGATASLASSVIAMFRSKTELERAALGGAEGATVSTRPSFLLSLPAVFLAWAVVAFVTGVMLYAFRGSVVVGGDPAHWTERFAEFTRWTAVGVLGFCGGVLIASLFFVRL